MTDRSSDPSLAPAIVCHAGLDGDETLGPLTLPAMFLALTKRHAEREALTIDGDTAASQRWRYKELEREAFAIAKALIAGGLGKGERVGILMTNSPNFLAAVFGTALAGGVATMLSTFSTRDELSYLLTRSCCSVVLFEPIVLSRDFGAMLADFDPATASQQPPSPAPAYLRTCVSTAGPGHRNIQSWDSFRALGEAISDDLVLARAHSVAPADPGVLFFSSGSTSKPKGILSSHRGVCIQMWRMKSQQGLPDGVRSWTANGFFWSGNFAMVIGATLVAGGSLVLQATFEPERALNIISAGRAEFLFAWPHQWTQLRSAPNWDSVDLSSVRFVDPDCPLATHPSITSDWIEPRFCYGNTETFTLISGFPAGTTEDQSRGSHGRPFPGNTIKIVNPLDGSTMRFGERGEIAVKGPTLMLGYLGVPLDETLDDEGFFHTGDGGYLSEDGLLFWEGRLNDIIKTGGANVSPLEVDEILREVPGVKLCQTVGIADPELGEMVVSCIVAEVGVSLTETDVRTFARQRLASYKVPRRVLFFTADEIALTGTAKIVTSELRERATKRLTG